MAICEVEKIGWYLLARHHYISCTALDNQQWNLTVTIRTAFTNNLRLSISYSSTLLGTSHYCSFSLIWDDARNQVVPPINILLLEEAGLSGQSFISCEYLDL